MTEVKITVGGGARAIEDEAAREFIDAWHRGERGATLGKRHIAFESWEALARVLTGKRLELLRHVHRHPARSIRALSQALGRDYSNVHADLRALADAGLLDTTGGGARAPYDTIRATIAL